MAKNSDILNRGKVIYSIYVRNHTNEGTFNAIIPDLDRIKNLGTDIIWFMPIHPIGEKGKKGTLGCPYSNRDYRTTNPEYGSMEEFKKLVDEIHKRGMKCMIDVVYNHTSKDSVLVQNHEEYFYHTAEGSLGNRVADWSDVIDLDYTNTDLWDYQIESLKMWAQIVDGFRCDVASLIPIEFWMRARKEVAGVNKNCIWLAETIDYGFIKYLRSRGLVAHSDSEIYSAFDITYEYDIWNKFQAYIDGKQPLNIYIDAIMQQEVTFPDNYIKLRYLENHDQKRIAKRVKNKSERLNYTAFTYFQKGTTLIYAGQEYENDYVPSLFEKNPINRNTGHDISEYLRKLYDIKQNPLFVNGDFELKAYDDVDVVSGSYTNMECQNDKIIGVFCLKEIVKEQYYKIPVSVEDGVYINLIDGKEIVVFDGSILPYGFPIIIQSKRKCKNE